jgi:tetratricopeptide (TPR) repeat protein
MTTLLSSRIFWLPVIVTVPLVSPAIATAPYAFRDSSILHAEALTLTTKILTDIDRAIANGEIDKVIPLLRDLRSQAQKDKDTALEVKVLSRLQLAYYCQGAIRRSMVVAQDLSKKISPLANRDVSNQKLVAAIADNIIWYQYAGVEQGNSDHTDEVIKEYLENINRAKNSDVKARFYLGLAYAYYLQGDMKSFDNYKQKLERIYPKFDNLGENADLTLILSLIKFNSATSRHQKDDSLTVRAAATEQEKKDRLAIARITALQQRYEKVYPIVKFFSHINLVAIYFASENYSNALAILANSEQKIGKIPDLFRYHILNYLANIAAREKRYSQASNYYSLLGEELHTAERNNGSDGIPAALYTSILNKLVRIKYLSGKSLSQKEIFSLVYASSEEVFMAANNRITQQFFNDRLGDGIIAQKSLIAQGLIWDAFAASEYTRTKLSRLSLGDKMSIRDDEYVKRSMDMNLHPFKESLSPNSVWNLAFMIQSQNRIEINQKYGDSVHKILGGGRSTIVEYAYNFVEKNPVEIFIYIIKPGMDTMKMKPILRCIPLDLSLASDICKSYANPKSSLPSQERASITNLGLKKYIQQNLFNVENCRRGGIPRKDGCSSPVMNDSQKTYRSLQSLHQLLIEPIADLLPSDQYEKVIFIPQGDLFSIPFTALKDSQGKYLIEKHTISLAPSLMLLDRATKLYLEEYRAQSKGVLVVGNPTISRELSLKPHSLEPLSAAETEAKSIAQMYGVEPLIGDRATKESVLKQLAGARIVHLATHGILDKSNSLDNSIVIAPTPTNAKGTLLAREIPANKAELVILSACDSGVGEVSTDQGYFILNRVLSVLRPKPAVRCD